MNLFDTKFKVIANIYQIEINENLYLKRAYARIRIGYVNDNKLVKILNLSWSY